MFFGRVVVQLTLAFVAIHADEISNSDAGRTSDDGSGINAGDLGGVLYLPAEALQSQLLNTVDIAPDTVLTVASSYSALENDSLAMTSITTPNTTVFASV